MPLIKQHKNTVKKLENYYADKTQKSEIEKFTLITIAAAVVERYQQQNNIIIEF